MSRIPGTALAAVTAALSMAGLCAIRLRRATSTLLDLEVDAETAALRVRVREAEMKRRSNAITNGLTALEGAAGLLDRSTLPVSDRTSLHGVLDSEFERLHHLVSEDDDQEGRLVSLAAVAERLSEDPTWCQRLQLDVAPDLRASGSAEQTLEAARQLLTYVSRRAPDNPITVRGETDAEWSVLWVEVRAPGTSRRRHRGVDCSDRRPARAAEMQLRTASRLVRGQGGHLRIQDRPGGGASFGLRLPAA
jgi:hypothetical protein